MSASTDAIVDPKETANNLVNIGGSRKDNQQWEVTTPNGTRSYVQTRSNIDGSRSYVVTERDSDGIYRPFVLGTVDKDGFLRTGGKGRTYNINTKTPGGVLVTSSALAKSILTTGTIGGTTATQSQQLALGDSLAVTLSKKRQSNNPRSVIAPPNAFVPAQRVGTDPGQQKIVTPHNATTTPSVDPSVVQPGNNDPNASNGENFIQKITENPGEALGDLVDFAKKELPGFLETLKLSDEDIAKFEAMFERGGGDKIEGGVYPIDANYNTIRGQDYVTIDQFIYQPPRRNQIIGDRNPDGENPIEQIFQGSQRISPLKKFVAQVKLPMPNDITDSNAVAWGDDAMNNMSAALTSAVMRNPAAGLAGGLLSSLVNPTLGKAVALAGAALDNPGVTGPDGTDASFRGKMLAVSKMIEAEGLGVLSKTSTGAGILGMLGVNVSPESILSRGFGVIPNSNTELLFNNVTLRDFQFSWRMSPRDEQEALAVKRIIRFFKQGMAAKTQRNQAGQRSVYLGAPNIFRLQYRTAGGRIIEGVNRIKPCAVVGTAVNYTPDGQWSAYDEGQPVSCTLSIQMKELEPVYATDYSQQVIESRRSGEAAGSREQFVGPFADPEQAVADIPVGEGDLYSIRPTEVGY